MLTQKASIHRLHQAGELPHRSHDDIQVGWYPTFTKELRKILLVLFVLQIGDSSQMVIDFFFRKMHLKYHAKITTLTIGCSGIEQSLKYETELARFKPSSGTEVFLSYFRTCCAETLQETLHHSRLFGIINERRFSKMPDPAQQLIFIPDENLRCSPMNLWKPNRVCTKSLAIQEMSKQMSQGFVLQTGRVQESQKTPVHLKRQPSQEASDFNFGLRRGGPGQHTGQGFNNLSNIRSPAESQEISGFVADARRKSQQSPFTNKSRVRVSNQTSPFKSKNSTPQMSDFSFSNSPIKPAHDSKKSTSFKITKSSVRRNRVSTTVVLGQPKLADGPLLASPQENKLDRVVLNVNPKGNSSALEKVRNQSLKGAQENGPTAILPFQTRSPASLAVPSQRIASPKQQPAEALALSLHCKSQSTAGVAGSCSDQLPRPAEKTAESFSKRLELHESMKNLSNLDTKQATENIETLVTPTNYSTNSSALFRSQTQEFLQIPNALAAFEHKRNLLKKHPTVFGARTKDRFSSTSFSLCIEKEFSNYSGEH